MTARTPQFARALEYSARDMLFDQTAPAKAPRDAESDAAALRAAVAGPVRRNMALDQADHGDLPLFIATNEPTLFWVFGFSG